MLDFLHGVGQMLSVLLILYGAALKLDDELLLLKRVRRMRSD